MRFLRSFTALSLAGLLTLSSTATAFGATRQYDDFESITSHVDTTVPQTLSIASPAAAISTTSDGYYLTGSSDPNQPLYLNGETVPDRGIYGSWGVYVPLYAGENTYQVTQGDASKSVTITKGSSGAITTDALTNAFPAYHSAYNGGAALTFSVVAPYGATVWVEWQGSRIELTPVAAAQSGVEARYKGSITLGAVEKASNVGPVEYGMSWNGENKSLSSAGSLYLYPQGQTINVQVLDTVATIYKAANNDNQISTVVRGGAIDHIADQTDTKYQLGMGGWIYKDSVQPLLSGSSRNAVTSTGFSQDEKGERITLTGTTNPIATTWQVAETLYVKLHNTSGVDKLSVAESRLFSGVTVTTEGDSTVLEFAIQEGQTMWGHAVEYKDNVTTIYCKYPPKKSSDSQKPLSGIVVGLDAGHGGSDPGALGIARLTGPVEKDVTYASTIAAKKRLESLGATVIMTTYEENQKSSPSDRMQAATDGRADFYLSLHCNSVAGNGLKPNGVEIYYYYNRSKPLAEKLLQNIVAETGRTNRGVKSSAFRVTLNSLTPAVLVEMGFISNPKEYDNMCSKKGVFQMANAIGNSLIDLL